MKSINHILKNDKTLFENNQVKDLIDYCHSLEDEIIETTQKNQNSFEDKLSILINELKRDIDETVDNEKLAEEYPFRNLERPDFKKAIFNLQRYLNQFSKDYNYNFDKN